ncbi:tubulin folding cofactor A [Ophidiomyces ophidiicola]|uniref:Tubulin folding cofactor A n=1 Tax=Ophidiomyces ophidiicola TaxID=1387563 RepID=A0ACB8V132_9EURO|nr:tubulin folding cofactor A [Ophidiomyces ophidiicola]KAI1909203.1 tubulin folding cofactor A [Ophidiomyces ophidiicola]KAI1919352.1 tubulin folding cofactor A [Ophidiomyces ophidiicola]KAI1928326.1 tubulin folding cofactor A [Ophidiomyces ophidiicola]KAI1951276.1 tubulin folding cofactor A [Ophidiomyces ophidiicola]KAI1953580.1 tubulin folding cofactor A [Ophidiomyces ophidiicola]
MPQIEGNARHPISLATLSLRRLVAEEASYHKELEQQKTSIEKKEQGLKNIKESPEDEGNAQWMLNQERTAFEETKKVMVRMEEVARNAMEKLEGLLRAVKNEDDVPESIIKEASEEIEKAKLAIPGLARSA